MIIAYAFGDQQTVEVHVKKAGLITEKVVQKMFAKNKSLKLISVEEKEVEQAN